MQRRRLGGVFQKIPHVIVPFEQCLDLLTQFAVADASALQVRRTFAGGQLKRFCKHRYLAIREIVHFIAAFWDLIAVIAATSHKHKARFDPQKAKATVEIFSPTTFESGNWLPSSTTGSQQLRRSSSLAQQQSAECRRCFRVPTKVLQNRLATSFRILALPNDG